ncbi:OadG family transporter subunit [Mediterranea massiliensis]|jgi:Na+-transporting methylmalonyl-CoA/oxaloacetate decarboxylase gamma subunit|uniref:OadG family transporter subunit n=1 Tax=Mediterranea massiliensis TaxID=1841865 RepID=UPI0025A3CC1B|nr:OadG family transporter subunit [Mediterranea massiliensis]MDM8337459.1 OadG family transporter subunit [Mediterranea massiliensis]
MNKKKIGILIAAFMAVCGNSFGQSASSLRINEVLVNNKENFQDDYGKHEAWIEIFNTSFATVDIRNCYLTNDKRVLDKNLSAPERSAMMYPIPKGDVLTKIPPRQHLLFWADNEPKRGNFHLSFELDSIGPNWIALYDANGTTLIDSITVPANLPVDCSYGLVIDGVKESGWAVMGIDNRYVTPSTNNKTLDSNEKIDGFKTKDPFGIGMAIMAMLVVFCGLILLYIAFKIVGGIGLKIAKRNAMRAHGIEDKKEAKEKAIGTESGEVFAAIAMALHEYQDNVHDIEDTILTINKVKRNYSPWSSKIYTLRQTPHK